MTNNFYVKVINMVYYCLWKTFVINEGKGFCGLRDGWPDPPPQTWPVIIELLLFDSDVKLNDNEKQR